MIVLDTNVLSELMRPSPDAAVSRWIGDQQRESIFVTTITQAEIYFGLELLPAGRRKAGLLEIADQMFSEDFRGCILPFDALSARLFGQIAASRRAIGRPVGNFDGQIAAVAVSRGFALATRNVADFVDCGLTIIDPWRY